MSAPTEFRADDRWSEGKFTARLQIEIIAWLRMPPSSSRGLDAYTVAVERPVRTRDGIFYLLAVKKFTYQSLNEPAVNDLESRPYGSRNGST